MQLLHIIPQIFQYQVHLLFFTTTLCLCIAYFVNHPYDIWKKNCVKMSLWRKQSAISWKSADIKNVHLLADPSSIYRKLYLQKVWTWEFYLVSDFCCYHQLLCHQWISPNICGWTLWTIIHSIQLGSLLLCKCC